MDERWRLRLGRVEQRSWVEVTLEKLPLLLMLLLLLLQLTLS